MRLLVNHSKDDIPHRQSLVWLLKEQGLHGVASMNTYDITTIQQAAKKGNCEAILLTNPETLKNLLGEKASLDKYRGSRINYEIPIIVANPIEHVHTVTYGKWLLQSDLRKFRHIKRKPLPFSFIVADTPGRQAHTLGFLRDCILISFDIETDDKRQITCISFTGLHKTGKVEVFLVPLVDFTELHYPKLEDFQAALELIQQIQALPIPKLAWNYIYDSQYCITYHAEPLDVPVDAMILGWSRYSELPRYLDFAASIHCYDYFQWKDEADVAKKNKDIRGFWAYCAKDSWNTLRIFLSQIKDLAPYQIHNYLKTIPLVFPSLYVAFEGFRVDNQKRIEKRAEFVAKQEAILKDLRTITCNPKFNPGSWQQVGHFIYDVIGAKRLTKSPTGGTDSKTLNRVAMQHPLLAKLCDMIITYREDTKAVNQYCDFDQLFGRLLYNIDPSGTETARGASKASNFWVGTQIQNIPPYAKEYLIADEGYVLLEADKNKSEARCVAYNSQCQALIDALEDPRDFYKRVSELFFGIPWDQVSDQLRNDVTKHIIHGTHHLMGPQPFIDTATPKRLYDSMKLVNTKLRNLEAYVKYLLSLYHKAFTDVKVYWKRDVQDVVALTHMTVSHRGWTRYFFGDIRRDHRVLRSAVAHQSQNLSVDIINDEELAIYQQLVLPSNGDFRLKAQIHDSILTQAKEEQADYWTKRMSDLMQTEVKVHGKIMKIPTDIKRGKVWKHIQKVDITKLATTS